MLVFLFKKEQARFYLLMDGSTLIFREFSHVDRIYLLCSHLRTVRSKFTLPPEKSNRKYINKPSLMKWVYPIFLNNYLEDKQGGPGGIIQRHYSLDFQWQDPRV